jgi:GNAT superfamily N-acetyltransferase
MSDLPKLITYDSQPRAAQDTAPQLDLPDTDGVLTYLQSSPSTDGTTIVTAQLAELNQPPQTVLRLDYSTHDAPTTITLEQLQVQPEHQNHGHGKRAIRHVANAAQAAGYAHCDAVTIEETSVAWIIPVEQGALEAGPGQLTFDLNEADAFYTWLNDGSPPQAA